MSEKTIRIPRYDAFKPASKAASKAKRKNRKTDSQPEVLLRRALWQLGLRYRKNVKTMPGKPDIVFLSARVAVFCDGDFWHGRNWEALQAKLKRGSNPDYWIPKISRNMQRDVEHNETLESEGWLVIRLWESDIRQSPEDAARQIQEAVQSRRD